MTDYYISDLHLFDERVYPDAGEERIQNLIKKWNSHVYGDDTVYIVGDLCSGQSSKGTIKKICKVLDQLHGDKVLILGNHDSYLFRNGKNGMLKSRFIRIQDNMTITDRDTGYRVTMSHYPCEEFAGSFKEKNIMIYGHVHNTAEETAVRFRRLLHRKTEDELNIHKVINVGAMLDYMDDTPRRLSELLEVETTQSQQLLEIYNKYDFSAILSELTEIRNIAPSHESFVQDTVLC